MNLHINNYEILNFPSEDLIISEKGVSRITSKPLIAALNLLKNCDTRNISKTKIIEILTEHQLNPDTAFDFIEKILVIRKSISNCYFKKTIILHDWGSEFEKIAHQELSPPVEIFDLTAPPQKIDKNRNHFIFILCKTYDYLKLKPLYFDIAHKNPSSSISIGFITGNTFTISPPYIFEIGNPCHYCKIDRPKQHDTKNQRDNSWQKLLDLCKIQKKPIPVNEPSLLQKSLIFGSTFEHIKLYTRQGISQRHQDSLFQTMHTNLSNGLITEEPISHWHMCDCMRPNL